VGEAPLRRRSKNVHEPFASNDESIVRGDTLFHASAGPATAKTMAGDRPGRRAVHDPRLTCSPKPRANRADGFIYNYMRYGGVVMPSYGNAPVVA